MICILNFNATRELSEIKYFYDEYRGTNINFLLDDFMSGTTNWSVPQNAVPGDVVLFYCSKEARHYLGMATSHIPDNYSQDFRTFVSEQKALYKKYSGCILGCGVIAAKPVYEPEGNRWYADIDQLRQFAVPIFIDEFKNFISINRLSSITYLKDNQWEHLKWVVNQKNPGFFESVTELSAETLIQEFNESVKKEGKKSLSKLKKDAEKKASQPTASSVQTKVYHRDPTIAAYVKKRANGYCQLCGQKAPFNDPNGEPYLECHHIDWLSKGDMDSVDNCVALCPNCHRKMHLLNDINDVMILKAKIQ